VPRGGSPKPVADAWADAPGVLLADNACIAYPDCMQYTIRGIVAQDRVDGDLWR
jgi:hypothetical protein